MLGKHSIFTHEVYIQCQTTWLDVGTDIEVWGQE